MTLFEETLREIGEFIAVAPLIIAFPMFTISLVLLATGWGNRKEA
jgi:hypothetical protein